MGTMNVVNKGSRILTKEEINKILLEIGKYFYLSNFNITLSNKINQQWKIVVSYKVSWSKSGEKIMINDIITL